MAYKQKSEDLKGVTNAMSNRATYSKSTPGSSNEEEAGYEQTPHDPKAVALLRTTPGGMEMMAEAYTKQTGSTLYEGELYEGFRDHYASEVFGK